jgi:hypothetical protein
MTLLAVVWVGNALKGLQPAAVLCVKVTDSSSAIARLWCDQVAASKSTLHRHQKAQISQPNVQRRHRLPHLSSAAAPRAVWCGTSASRRLALVTEVAAFKQQVSSYKCQENVQNPCLIMHAVNRRFLHKYIMQIPQDLSAGHHAADGAPQDLGRRSKVEGSLTRIGVPRAADMENSAGSLLPLDV